GLWLVLIGYLVLTTVLQVVLTRIGASGGVHVGVGVLVAILVGFEAASLRRWALARRRWRNLGVVVADDLELAERRFFDAWLATAHASHPAQASRRPVRPGRTVPDVIGLFPEPGAQP